MPSKWALDWRATRPFIEYITAQLAGFNLDLYHRWLETYSHTAIVRMYVDMLSNGEEGMDEMPPKNQKGK